MRIYKAAAFSLAIALPAFFLGMTWAHRQTVDELRAASEIMSTVIQEMRETRASVVLALINSLEATRSASPEVRLVPLERALHTQLRLLEMRSEVSPAESALVAQALEKGRAYTAAHPLPRDPDGASTSKPFSQASILPVYEAGSLVGLRISALVPGSFLESIGVRDGDLLVAVQGESITSPSQLAEAFRIIERQPADLDLEVIRAGEMLRLGIR